MTHPSWKMKRRMPYASRERRAGKSSTPVSSPAHGFPRRAARGELRHDGRAWRRSESSGTHQTMLAITMHSSRRPPASSRPQRLSTMPGKCTVSFANIVPLLCLRCPYDRCVCTPGSGARIDDDFCIVRPSASQYNASGRSEADEYRFR